VILGETMLRNVIKNYGSNYHTERNHQGLGNELIEDQRSDVEESEKVVKLSRLGGVLKYYERQAA
jgi:hypothetical protein